MKNISWLKDAIIYQINPYSFKDSDFDGIGDLKGIISKLDYLKNLDINVILLSNLISSVLMNKAITNIDYYKLNDGLGDFVDLKELIKKAHENNIKVLLDLNIAFVSISNPWFIDACNNKDSKYKDYFLFTNKDIKLKTLDGRNAFEKENNLKMYYLHSYGAKSVDLNYDNPNLRLEMEKVFRFYLDIGFDGFKLNGLDTISKNKEGKNSEYLKGPHLHTYIKEFYEDVFSKYDCVIIGENYLNNSLINKEMLKKENREINILYNYDYLFCDVYKKNRFRPKHFSLYSLKKAINKFQSFSNDASNLSIVYENIYLRRILGKFNSNDNIYSKEATKMLLSTFYLLKGIPFIYQGSELGLTNLTNLKYDELIDEYAKNELLPLIKNIFYKKKALDIVLDNAVDHSLQVIPWDDSEYASFSSVFPKYKLNDKYYYLNVNSEENDNDSILNYFKKIISIRKKYSSIINSEVYKNINFYKRNVLAYQRGKDNEVILVFSNFSSQKVKIDYSEIYEEYKYRILLNNYDSFNGKSLSPYQCVVIYLIK